MNAGILRTTHNAGLFSCCTIRLLDILNYFNENRCLPLVIDSSKQFDFYKDDLKVDLSPQLFLENQQVDIQFKEELVFPNDGMSIQFKAYKELDLINLKPFISRYFNASELVAKAISNFENKYNLDYPNTCAVFYRGNDKSKETALPRYHEFIKKAQTIKALHEIKYFLVQTDDIIFRTTFKEAENNSFLFSELPAIQNLNSSVTYEIPRSQRAQFAINFLAATMVVSRCQQLITNSGNCGLWAFLLRGTDEGMHQWHNGEWYE